MEELKEDKKEVEKIITDMLKLFEEKYRVIISEINILRTYEKCAKGEFKDTPQAEITIKI